VEVSRLRDSWQELQDLGVEVVGVSYDSPEKNRGFAEAQGLPFRLLSDTDRVLARSLGAGRALLPVPKRISYLVGPDGRILKTYANVSPKRHAEEVIADYRALVRADGGH
jgi:peroxiredoxin Q/BCP